MRKVSSKIKIMHPRNNSKWRCSKCLLCIIYKKLPFKEKWVKCYKGNFDMPYDKEAKKQLRRMKCSAFLYEDQRVV